MNSERASRPIVFFDVATHYGGSRLVIVELAKQLKRHVPVLVVDAYGNCTAYMQALADAAVPTKVLQPDERRGVIGGRGRLGRVLRLAGAVPDLVGLVRRMRALVEEVSPRALVVTLEKPLLIARHAVPRSVPIVYYAMGELRPPRWYLRATWNRIDLLLGISRNSLQGVAGRGYQPRRAGVLYSGIDAEEARRLAVVPKVGLPGTARPLKLLFPASLIALKAQDVALRALARVPGGREKIQLWLSGDKPRGADHGYPADLLRLVRELQLEECVSFIGWQDDILAAMAAADAVILTSRTEGVPCSLMQAMALGKPVIATRVGGIPELVRDGVDGLLVAVGDVDSVASALERLLDPHERARLGASGRRRVEESFTLEQQTMTFLRELDRVTPA